MDGKFCIECGRKLDMNARFCPTCGRPQPEIQIPAEIIKPEAAPVTADNAAEKVTAAVPESTAASAAETENETEPEKSSGPESAPETAAAPPPPPPPSPFTQPFPQPENTVNDVSAPEQKKGGMAGAYILLIVAALLIVALFVWAVFAMNKFSMTHKTKSSSSRSISVVKPGEPDISEYSGVGGKGSSSGHSGRKETSDKEGGYSGVGGKSGVSYEADDYTAGRDIPAGEYLVVADTENFGYEEEEYIPSFYLGVYEDPNEEHKVHTGWFQCSTYVKVNEGEDIHFSWATAYPADSTAVKNDPFERAGMFLVGKDVEPGEYEIESLTDQGYESYAVFDSIDDVMADDGFSSREYPYGEADKLTLREGQYVQLEWCRLKK
ncbi:MAG: zinc ribbon domain-containing protein [Ruminococcus sp.]|nr:zinc ribbon domain-containing protein [Ruminococcus sp.]